MRGHVPYKSGLGKETAEDTVYRLEKRGLHPVLTSRLGLATDGDYRRFYTVMLPRQELETAHTPAN
jgi:hypothetical protein